MALGMERRRSEAASPPTRAGEAAVIAARRAFGPSADIASGAEADHVLVDGLEFAYAPGDETPFTLVPECDRCGSNDHGLFPLEEWVIDGVHVRAQGRATCRDCRFLDAAAGRTT
jgi:hypothetical protein